MQNRVILKLNFGASRMSTMMCRRGLSACCWLVCMSGVLLTAPGMVLAKDATSRKAISIKHEYQTTAIKIIDAAMASNEVWDKMEALCLDIGHRLSGSPQLDQAIAWAANAMKADGQQNVHTEAVMVPRWVRGQESATMIAPRHERLAMLGLGGSVGTPEKGITAQVVVADNEDEMNALGEAVKGKIVLFNQAMPAYTLEHGSGYGTGVYFRTHGARLAAKLGAVAVLVRSATAKSLRSPHTGAMRYGDAEVKIPAAAISLEDTNTIVRLVKRGVAVRVNMMMAAKNHPDAESANVIGELVGATNPEEIVVIGGHIDSWDVGHGAHDDGAGCVMAMEAINVLRKLNLRPRRTIRVVLWTNEENGLAGGKAYAKQHAAELSHHVAAIESDSGAFAPRGYSVDCEDESHEAIAAAQLKEIISLMQSLGTLEAKVGGSGADVSPMKPAGVVLMGHRVEGSTYFDYHHTLADTLDKVDPKLLSQNVAAMATMAYILADMPDRLGTTSMPMGTE